MPSAMVANPANGAPIAGVNKRYRPAPAKTFQCRGYGECRMVFSRSEHLARHIRKHTGERPFTCHCGKQFSRLDNLRQHAQTVHADKQEQNERMMRDLTSLHATMAAANKVGSTPRGTRRTSSSTSTSTTSNASVSIANSNGTGQQHPHSPGAADVVSGIDSIIKQEELGVGVRGMLSPTAGVYDDHGHPHHQQHHHLMYQQHHHGHQHQHQQQSSWHVQSPDIEPRSSPASPNPHAHPNAHGFLPFSPLGTHTPTQPQMNFGIDNGGNGNGRVTAPSEHQRPGTSGERLPPLSSIVSSSSMSSGGHNGSHATLQQYQQHHHHHQQQQQIAQAQHHPLQHLQGPSYPHHHHHHHHQQQQQQLYPPSNASSSSTNGNGNANNLSSFPAHLRPRPPTSSGRPVSSSSATSFYPNPSLPLSASNVGKGYYTGSQPQLHYGRPYGVEGPGEAPAVPGGSDSPFYYAPPEGAGGARKRSESYHQEHEEGGYHAHQQQQHPHPHQHPQYPHPQGPHSGAHLDPTSAAYDYGSDSRPASRRLTVMELCNDSSRAGAVEGVDPIVFSGAFLLSQSQQAQPGDGGTGAGTGRPGTASGLGIVGNTGALTIFDHEGRGSGSPPGPGRNGGAGRRSASLRGAEASGGAGPGRVTPPSRRVTPLNGGGGGNGGYPPPPRPYSTTSNSSGYSHSQHPAHQQGHPPYLNINIGGGVGGQGGGGSIYSPTSQGSHSGASTPVVGFASVSAASYVPSSLPLHLFS
ncbi:hypothetical protein DXG03_005386 [Asterophora parasitica]|uniref:C2H2-type domain-containing protein n=1 Tax=Asterophora parasitica TaxID=117018 RepID=A0A9P7K7K0_9AGAR|nr:hypothetical protein DXG03_005386 [Asterophora parasitica]